MNAIPRCVGVFTRARVLITLAALAAVNLASPPAAHATAYTYANDEEVKRDLTRFLTQATFGANEAEVNNLFASISGTKTVGANVKAALTAWIDAQWTTPQTELYGYHYSADQQEWSKRAAMPLPSRGGNQLWRQRIKADGTGMGGDDPDLHTPANFTDRQAGSAAEWQVWDSDPKLSREYTRSGDTFTLGVDIGAVGSRPEYNYRRGWWLLANRAKDQLRQRTAAALEEVFVVSDLSATLSKHPYALSRYHDMLADLADGVRDVYPPKLAGDNSPGLLGWGYSKGAAVTYRELLTDVTLSPVMGYYLSHLKNQKPSGTFLPDENYAREILQLFSIGLYKLNNNGTYTDGTRQATYGNLDIEALARVFTGFSHRCRDNGDYASHQLLVNNPNNNNQFLAGNGSNYFSQGWESPMMAYKDFHDLGEKKMPNLSSASIDWTFPAMQQGGSETTYADGEITLAMGNLSSHQNVPPFISQQLIQRLVTSNPSNAYVGRISQAFRNTNGVRGSIREVVKAILLDDDARDLANVSSNTFGKVKEPIIRYIQVLRALDASSSLDVTDPSFNPFLPPGYAAQLVRPTNAGGTSQGTRFRFPETMAQLGQTPMHMPSVFSWFFPDYRPADLLPASLVAPELQLATESSVVANLNYHYTADKRWELTTDGIPVDGLPWLAGSDTSANVRLQLTPFVDAYTADGSAPAIKVANLVDRLDRLLCAGSLKARYPDGGSGPVGLRKIIIDSVTGVTGTASKKVEQALYLITAAPEFIVQK